MKVLQVYRTYFPDTQGGLQETIRQIALNTKPLGVESRIFTPSPDPSPPVIESHEGEIHRVNLDFEIASCGFSFSGMGRFSELMDWADIVHYHFPWPFADCLYFVDRMRHKGHRQKKSLLTYHSDIVRQQMLAFLYAPLMNQFLDSVDRIICTSDHYLHSSVNLLARQDKTSVIPIGLNESSYPTRDEVLTEKLRLQYGEDFFLFVGVLRYYKGLHIVLEAMQGAPFNLVIAGQGPYRKHLERQALQLKLNNVHFAGHVPDPEKVALYHLCRGVVLPSHLRSEAFGVTLVEGSMYGKPLVSVEAGSGTSFVNNDGKTGLVVPPENPGALRQAMDQIYEDRERAEEMGECARERYETLFSGEAMGKAYYKVYQKLLEDQA